MPAAPPAPTTAGGSSGLRTRTARGGTGRALAEAETLITGCLRAGRPGRYVLQAAIASLYAEAPAYEQTDWPQLVALYDELLRVWPSPVVALNRAVPLAMAAGPRSRPRGGRAP